MPNDYYHDADDDACDCGECRPKPSVEFKQPNTIDRIRAEVEKELKDFSPEQRQKAEKVINGAYTLLETMLSAPPAALPATLGQMPTIPEGEKMATTQITPESVKFLQEPPIHLFDTEPYGEIPAKEDSAETESEVDRTLDFCDKIDAMDDADLQRNLEEAEEKRALLIAATQERWKKKAHLIGKAKPVGVKPIPFPSSKVSNKLAELEAEITESQQASGFGMDGVIEQSSGRSVPDLCPHGSPKEECVPAWEPGDNISFNDQGEVFAWPRFAAPAWTFCAAPEPKYADCGFCPFGTSAMHLKGCASRDEARAARSIEVNRQRKEYDASWENTHFENGEEVEDWGSFPGEDSAPKTSYDQPAPVENDHPALWPQVGEDASKILYNENTALIARLRTDMVERDAVGRARYGTPLQPHNGRDALADAYSEALDMLVYLKQATVENPSNTDALNLYHGAFDFAANLLRALALSEGLKR